MLRFVTFAVLASSITGQPTPPRAECVRVSGDQIGQLPLAVQVGRQRVEFLEWKATDISGDTLIGFTARAPEQVHFSVEAGGRTFAASSNWLHPAGVVGPGVRPIAAVTLCAE